MPFKPIIKQLPENGKTYSFHIIVSTIIVYGDVREQFFKLVSYCHLSYTTQVDLPTLKSIGLHTLNRFVNMLISQTNKSLHVRHLHSQQRMCSCGNYSVLAFSFHK